MSTTHQLQAVFWLGLAAFLSWDFLVSAPVDLRNEPPLIAAGSGQAGQWWALFDGEVRMKARPQPYTLAEQA
jgi:hypothetical protein